MASAFVAEAIFLFFEPKPSILVIARKDCEAKRNNPDEAILDSKPGDCFVGFFSLRSKNPSRNDGKNVL
jgi:hypothetical protein